MALIQCSECGQSVSDKAAACPKCGNLIAATDKISTTNEKVVTVQGTGKGIKRQQLLATLLCCVGVMMILAGSSAGALITVGSMGWFMLTRFLSWWHHG